MFLPVLSPTPGLPGSQPRREPRRGVTSIEYVFILSLIFLACIIGVQQVGQVTKSFFTTSADKTKVMDPAQQGR